MSLEDKDADLLAPGEPDEPLHDEAMRKALAQAPDRAVLPDWRVRQAILDHAHDAVSASEELLAASRERAPWWRPAWWRDKLGAPRAMPWNAAFATVLLGVMVTVMWQREPVPGARLDEQPAAAPPTASVEQQAPTVKEEARAPEAPAPRAPVPVEVPRSAPEPAPAPTPAPATVAPPPPPDVAAPPAAPAPAASDALAPRERSAPAAPQAAPSTESNRAAAATGARPAPAPDFGALSRWTELRLANVAGEVRTVSRADAGELSQLLSSAAIVAAGGPPLRALPEWRVALERKGEVLAVLEVGRSQVRWTEGKAPPVTGTPSPEALEALRAALRQAVRAKAPARATGS
ncbi:hypothetical protein ACIPRI_09330 [Variovorax sp. LARHSF232]